MAAQRLRLALIAITLCLPAGINLLQYWLHNPLYEFGIWVPFLAGCLFWQRRNSLPSDISPQSTSVLPGAIIALYLLSLPILRTVQIANPDWRMLDWILALGAVTSLLALFYQRGGRRTLAQFWLPAAFLLTAVPWSTSAERDFVTWAIPVTARVASELLWGIGVAAVESGKTLYSSAGPIQVSEDCSGIRSIHLAIMVTVFWIAYFRLPMKKAALVSGLALVLTLSLNVLRVAALVLVAVTYHLETMHRWHDSIGSIAQVLLVLGLPAIAWLVAKNCTSFRGAPSTEEPNPSTLGVNLRAIGWVPLAVLAWCLGVEAIAEGWFRIHESGHRTSDFWALNLKIPGRNVTEDTISDSVKENYFYSTGHRLVWNDDAGSPWSITYLDFDRGAISACTHNVHRPEVCLGMADVSLVETLPPLQLSIAGRELLFAHQVFQKGNQFLHLFHAYLQNSEQENGQTNWTYQGRLRAAALGIRSHRAELVHLAVQAPYSSQKARTAATGYLTQLLSPKAE